MTDARRQPVRGPSRLWPFKARDGIVTIVDLGAQKIACAIVCLTAPRFGLNVGARNIAVHEGREMTVDELRPCLTTLTALLAENGARLM